MKKVEDLKFVRTQDFNLIPRYLLNQFKDFEIDADDLYFWGNVAANNPTTLLYVLVDDKHKIKGFLWAVIDVLERVVFVKAYSIDKDYQSGDSIQAAVKVLEEEIETINKRTEAKMRPKIKFLTTRPNAFLKSGEKSGLKVTKQAIMEINLNEIPE